MLTVWLTASYTAQLDGSANRNAQGLTLQNQTGKPLVVGKSQNTNTLASPRTAASHALTTGSDTPPIARIK